MEFRNVNAGITKRYYVYVTLVSLISFFVLIGVFFVLGFFGKRQSVDNTTQELYHTDISSWKEGGSVTLQGKMYKKMIAGRDYYAFFANDGLKYVVVATNANKEYFDKNLGKEIELFGRIQKFLGSIPFISIIDEK